MKEQVIKPVAAADMSRGEPEFGRIADLDRLFGIKRGTAYNLVAAGAIESKLVKVNGRASGVRLVSLQSVRDYINNSAACATTEKQSVQNK